MLVRRPLADMGPRYLELEGRGRMGISLQCPREEDKEHFEAWGPHRIAIWFQHPEDDEGPNYDAEPSATAVHMGELDDIAHFSLYKQGGFPIRVHQHWTGYVVEGMVYDAVSFGPGW